MEKIRKKRFHRIIHKGSFLKKAREHREETLKQIVIELLNHYNFNQIDWRSLPNYHTHKYEPDIFFENGNCLLIVELKAYHKSTVCAEREAAQILKYAAAVKSVKDTFEEYERKRFILITSGTSIPLDELKLNFNEDIKLIKKRYDDLIVQIGIPKNQDDYDRRSTYRKLQKKIEKGNDIFPSELIDFLPIDSFEIKNIKEFKNFLTGQKEFFIGFISAENFQKVLGVLNNEEPKILFELLRNIPIETLIKGKKISDYIF